MILSVGSEAVSSNFKGPETLLKGFFEGPPNSHGFPYGFHRYREGSIGSREFLEGKTGNLNDTVVYHWLKTGGSLLGYIIGYFVQGVTHG